MNKTFRSEALGLEVSIGAYARQADGAVVISSGDNVVLATVVASNEEKDFAGFFPLIVEYRERMSAAGKFPGGFIKREGRLSDTEVLNSRLIDRPIRPLFPEFYFNEVQVMATVYSSDGSFPPNILALIASSLALTISKIPFMGPVGAVKVGRLDGAWKINLSHDESKLSDVSIVVAGTKDGIIMVEGHCDKLTEQELVDVLFLAHEEIKTQVAWQEEVARALQVPKVELEQRLDWEAWRTKVHQALPKDFALKYYVKDKQERNRAVDTIRKDMVAHFAPAIEAKEISKAELLFLYDHILKDELPNAIAKQQKRIDGRAFDEIRPITVEVGNLPCVHGSSVFTRGETQALVSVTLGTASDVQRIEPLIGEMIEKSFMLHYNFPPFSTGEVKMIRGVGRRELGHGYLAETSFKHVLPKKDAFPYTLRSICDILESNGSSSMASVCGTTMALMDAGVPISDMVGGIAMGLMQDASGKFYVLSDILGTEDAFGLMDFKLTGTNDGIMAIQMDIKAKAGLTRDVFESALEQARRGRVHILGEMRKVLSAPREKISKHAPQITSFKVPQDKIGAIIGPQGKNIKEIIALTGVEIDIDEDGTVNIYAKDSTAAARAKEFAQLLAGEIEIGAEYKGIVKRHAEFGLFVDIFPGKGGLVHISSIAREKQADLVNICPIDSELDVKVTGYDRESGRIRLVAPAIEGPARKGRDDERVGGGDRPQHKKRF